MSSSQEPVDEGEPDEDEDGELGSGVTEGECYHACCPDFDFDCAIASRITRSYGWVT